MKKYQKCNEYIEYFAERSNGKRDYDFVQSKDIYPISDYHKLTSSNNKYDP